MAPLLAWLARLNRLNRTGVFLGVLVLVLGALLLPGAVGGVAVLVLVAALVALLGLTWRVLDPLTQVLRVVVLVLLLMMGIAKFA